MQRPKTERNHHADAVAEQHVAFKDALAHIAYEQAHICNTFAAHQANTRESVDYLRQATIDSQELLKAVVEQLTQESEEEDAFVRAAMADLIACVGA